MTPEIRFYGTERCHKTKYYQELLKELNKDFVFMDVEENENNADELRALYENKKLNFPTITIGTKKLRNPKKEDLEKWLTKTI